MRGLSRWHDAGHRTVTQQKTCLVQQVSSCEPLLQKRSIVARLSSQARAEAQAAREKLVPLDVRLEKATRHDSARPKRAYRRTRYFARNELSRLTQDALRTASGPLTSAEIAAAVMQPKGMPPDDAAFKEIVAKRALTVLRRLVKRGTVVKHGTSRDAQWALAP